MDCVGYFCILSTELCGQQKSCSLSLSFARSFLFVYKSDRSCLLARSLVRYAELFNVISFSILSADFFFFLGAERKKNERKSIYLYIYIYNFAGKKREISTESNQRR